jgi:hypothetical protein
MWKRGAFTYSSGGIAPQPTRAAAPPPNRADLRVGALADSQLRITTVRKPNHSRNLPSFCKSCLTAPTGAAHNAFTKRGSAARGAGGAEAETEIIQVRGAAVDNGISK